MLSWLKWQIAIGKVKLNKLGVWFVWKLPRKLVYWCYIRVHSEATCGAYSYLNPNEVSWDMALKAWDKNNLEPICPNG